MWLWDSAISCRKGTRATDLQSRSARARLAEARASTGILYLGPFLNQGYCTCCTQGRTVPWICKTAQFDIYFFFLGALYLGDSPKGSGVMIGASSDEAGSSSSSFKSGCPGTIWGRHSRCDYRDSECVMSLSLSLSQSDSGVETLVPWMEELAICTTLSSVSSIISTRTVMQTPAKTSNDGQDSIIQDKP